MAKVINTVLSLKDDFSGVIKKVEKNATGSMTRIKKAFDDGDSTSARLSSGFQAVGKEATRMGKAFMPASVAVGGALGACVKSASDFQQAMANTWSIAKAGNNNSTKAFQQLQTAAEEAGKQGYYSATEAADALGYMALAGWDANKSAKALPSVLNLAAAASMDLGAASDMVTDYMGAFSRSEMNAKQFTDMLSYAQDNSNTTVTQLGEAYKNCAANLNAAGQSAQTTTALLEAMANQGTKGSEAGTKLTAIMRDLTAHMEDGSVKIGDTNIKVQDANGNYRNLIDILADVDKATRGMGDAQKSAALSSVFTADSISGVNLIMNEGIDKVKGYSDALEKSGGSAADSAKTKYMTLQGALTILKNRFGELSAELGQYVAPYVQKLAEFIGKLAKHFDNLSEGQKKAIVVFGLAIAAIGPLLLIGGQLLIFFTNLRGAIALLSFNPMILEIGLAVAAIAALVWAVVTHWEQIKAAFANGVAKVTALLKFLKQVFLVVVFAPIIAIIKVAQGVLKLFGINVGTETSGISGKVKTMQEAWDRSFGTIIKTLEKAWKKIKDIGGKIKGKLGSIGETFSKTKQGSGKNLVGHNATGTSYWSGGLTSINEHGGEIVSLPNGTKIIPHDIAKQQVNGSNIQVVVNVQGNVIGNEAYADYLGDQISRRLMAALANS